MYHFFSISDLEEFMFRVDSGLRAPVKSGDYQVLVQVMGCLLDVRSRQPSTDQMFNPLTAVVNLLQQYGETLSEYLFTQLEVAIFPCQIYTGNIILGKFKGLVPEPN